MRQLSSFPEELHLEFQKKYKIPNILKRKTKGKVIDYPNKRRRLTMESFLIVKPSTIWDCPTKHKFNPLLASILIEEELRMLANDKPEKFSLKLINKFNSPMRNRFQVSPDTLSPHVKHMSITPRQKEENVAKTTSKDFTASRNLFENEDSLTYTIETENESSSVTIEDEALICDEDLSEEMSELNESTQDFLSSSSSSFVEPESSCGKENVSAHKIDSKKLAEHLKGEGIEILLERNQPLQKTPIELTEPSQVSHSTYELSYLKTESSFNRTKNVNKYGIDSMLLAEDLQSEESEITIECNQSNFSQQQTPIKYNQTSRTPLSTFKLSYLEPDGRFGEIDIVSKYEVDSMLTEGLQGEEIVPDECNQFNTPNQHTPINNTETSRTPLSTFNLSYLGPESRFSGIEEVSKYEVESILLAEGLQGDEIDPNESNQFNNPHQQTPIKLTETTRTPLSTFNLIYLEPESRFSGIEEVSKYEIDSILLAEGLQGEEIKVSKDYNHFNIHSQRTPIKGTETYRDPLSSFKLSYIEPESRFSEIEDVSMYEIDSILLAEGLKGRKIDAPIERNQLNKPPQQKLIKLVDYSDSEDEMEFEHCDSPALKSPLIQKKQFCKFMVVSNKKSIPLEEFVDICIKHQSDIDQEQKHNLSLNAPEEYKENVNITSKEGMQTPIEAKSSYAKKAIQEPIRKFHSKSPFLASKVAALTSLVQITPQSSPFCIPTQKMRKDENSNLSLPKKNRTPKSNQMEDGQSKQKIKKNHELKKQKTSSNHTCHSKPAIVTQFYPKATPKATCSTELYTNLTENQASEAEIEKDIWNTMLENELYFTPSACYLIKHRELEPKMRPILFNWLTEVCQEFHLQRQTFYLAGNILDRYLSETENFPKSRYQMLGACCLLISSKLEEYFPPTLSDFLVVCDNVCTRQEMKDMELEIMQVLKWRLQAPTLNDWLSLYFQNASKFKPEHFCEPDYLHGNQNTQTFSNAPTTIRPRSFYAAGERLTPKFHRRIFLKSIHTMDTMTHTTESLQFPASVLAATAFYQECKSLPDRLCTGYDVAQIRSCLEWCFSLKNVILESNTPQAVIDLPEVDYNTIQTHNPHLLKALERREARYMDHP